MKVAFLGLGNMGLPMALNLIQAGHQVHGFDLVQSQLDVFKAAGGISVGSASEAAIDADVIISMLPASRHVEALYLGDSGILATANPKSLLVDCSTISPKVSQAVAAAAKATGFANRCSHDLAQCHGEWFVNLVNRLRRFSSTRYG